MSRPPIIVTHEDLEALTELFARLPPSAEDAMVMLDEELARAEVVPAARVPADVVTMGSRVLFDELGSGITRVTTLVYPRSADPTSGRVSVLSPMGAALLGLRAGQTIEWNAEGGGPRRYRVRSVLHQPQVTAQPEAG